MNIQSQNSTSTEYNRYPEIFEEIAKHIKSNIRILSFGCSDGSEARCLKDLYFPQAHIDGFDIKSDIIESNTEHNTYSDIMYFSDYKSLQTYDLIFCMSVLCMYPPRAQPYIFDLFDKTLMDLDKLLEVGGYIVVYNSTYRFSDSTIYSKYTSVKTSYLEELKIIPHEKFKIKLNGSGFVSKLSKNGQTVKHYPYYLFKKLK